jgi:hypothetical protein
VLERGVTVPTAIPGLACVVMEVDGEPFRAIGDDGRDGCLRRARQIRPAIGILPGDIDAPYRCGRVTSSRLRPNSPQLQERSFELFEEFQGLFPAQGGHARCEHRHRPPFVLDEFGDRQIGHGVGTSEHMFA